MARAAGGVTMGVADRRKGAVFSRVRRAAAVRRESRPAIGGASARAEDCGKNGEGFSQWLNSFKQVATARRRLGRGRRRRARRRFL